MSDRLKLTDRELMYAATQRCRCGAGLAHPLDHDLAMELRSWVCSAVLKGEGVALARSPFAAGPEPLPGSFAAVGSIQSDGAHDSLPFVFWKVREETSINNHGGHTTRPAGTIARTVGKAKCPQCSHEWQSEPYAACGAGHHWFPGQCPACGYAVGANGTYNSREGAPIETRYPDMVLDAKPSEGTP